MVWNCYHLRVTNFQRLNIITVRNSSCRKVMFSQACVKNSFQGGVCPIACWDNPQGRHPSLGWPPPPTRWPLQRTVRILQECILVLEIFLSFPCLTRLFFKISFVSKPLLNFCHSLSDITGITTTIKKENHNLPKIMRLPRQLRKRQSTSIDNLLIYQ